MEYKTLFQYLYDDLFRAGPPLANANALDYLDFRYRIERHLDLELLKMIRPSSH